MNLFSVATGGSRSGFEEMVDDRDGNTLHARLLLGMQKKKADLGDW